MSAVLPSPRASSVKSLFIIDSHLKLCMPTSKCALRRSAFTAAESFAGGPFCPSSWLAVVSMNGAMSCSYPGVKCDARRSAWAAALSADGPPARPVKCAAIVVAPPTLSAAGVAPYSKWQRRRSSLASFDIAACLPFFSTMSSRYVVRMWSPWFS